MPVTRLPVFAAIAGALLGLGAFVLACQALTAAMTSWLGIPGGLAAGSAILAALAFAAFWFVARPGPEAAKEPDGAKSAAADFASGLPAEAAAALIRKHPITAVLAALMTGYALLRDPGRAMRQLRTLVTGLL